MNAIVVNENQSNIGSNDYKPTKKWCFRSQNLFSKSPYFNKIEITTLFPNRFKNQATIRRFKLLDLNCNSNGGFAT